MKTTYSFGVEIDGKTSGRIFDTKREAVNYLAGWSLRMYQTTGNFDHDKRTRIVRVY